MLKRLPHNVIALLHDGAVGVASFFVAIYLRMGNNADSVRTHYGVEWALGFGVILTVCMLYYRVYRRVWRYSTLNDLVLIAKTLLLALVIFYVVIFLVTRLEFMPRSMVLIQGMVAMFGLCLPRLLARMWSDYQGENRTVEQVPVLLVGATNEAETFIRESRRSAQFPYRVVGLLDASPANHGREIHHVRIYGTTQVVAEVFTKLERQGRAPQRIVLADTSLTTEQIAPLLVLAEARHVTLSRLPKLTELRQGAHSAFKIQPVAIEDILGRTSVVLPDDAVRDMLAGARVMVTGAGGSIGSELVRQIARSGVASVVLYDISEYNLYEIDRELQELQPHLPRACVVGDVRDAAQLARIMKQHQPQFVFHAAAIKHVPLAENNPEQAVLTNVLGTQQVAEACIAHQVAAMVQISTDKAVNPTSVMGATKRIAEMVVHSLAHADTPTRFITVRFGNVLGSTGSVVPLFQKQLAKGGPITVTHPDMTRYFMTIAEAVQLVMQAATLHDITTRAPIYVLEMGAPVKILDLARHMIRLAGLRLEQDITIEFTGMRPGEKLHEELFHDQENLLGTDHPSIRKAQARALVADELAPLLQQLLNAAHAADAVAIREAIQQLVPEYRYTPAHANTSSREAA
jgi:FlaA1/EpsC-like NDP-sugar epimerase